MVQKLVVITGGGSRHSHSAQLAERLRDQALSALKEAGIEANHASHHIGQYAYDFADYLSDGFPSDSLAAVLEDVRSASGVIVISPVFKASYSGLFKLFWDITEDGDLAGTPVLLAAVGGTSRHSLVLDHAMRPLFGHLGADTVATGIYATPDDLNGSSARFEGRLKRAAQELTAKMTRAKL